MENITKVVDVANANRLARLRHPKTQRMKITKIVEETPTMKTFYMEASDGHELAYFNAGDIIPVYVEIDGNAVQRPYGLSSSPKESLEGLYSVSVKKMDGGCVSSYIHENWKVGTDVVLGGPLSVLSYNPIRDRKNVIVLAGGSGITPIHSMAKAIVDGDIDCNMTLFYGVNVMDEIAYKDEWAELEKNSGGKFKMIPVVENVAAECAEHGYITLDIVKKYCSIDDCSWFLSGPAAMDSAMRKMLEALNIKRKFIRSSYSGDAEFHTDSKAEYTLTVHSKGVTRQIKAAASDTLLQTLEKNGYRPDSSCRSGKCGFCRTLVVSGSFKSLVEEDGVRRADRKYGYIHSCCCVPTSDMELIITER